MKTVAPMLEMIEEEFVAVGRTPKGCRARRAIFRAITSTVLERGLDRVSLDAVADRSGMTQAALRHHFHTREDLLAAFFVSASEGFRGQVTALLTRNDLPPRETLERCLSWHLEFMESVDTAFWLESSAYWLRHGPTRGIRDDFYDWMLQQYAGLIARLQPTLGAPESRRKAYVLLTLVLGAWITHGRGSTIGGAAGTAEERQLLLDEALEIATE